MNINKVILGKRYCGTSRFDGVSVNGIAVAKDADCGNNGHIAIEMSREKFDSAMTPSSYCSFWNTKIEILEGHDDANVYWIDSIDIEEAGPLKVGVFGSSVEAVDAMMKEYVFDKASKIQGLYVGYIGEDKYMGMLPTMNARGHRFDKAIVDDEISIAKFEMIRQMVRESKNVMVVKVDA